MAAIVRSIGLLFAASVAARGLGLIRSFWLARLLAPADYGALVFILLITAYAPIFSLGTVEALLKLVPWHNGRGDREAAREVDRGTFSFILLLALFFAALAPVTGLLLSRGAATAHYARPAAFVVLSLAFSVITAFFIHRLEAYKSFHPVSLLTALRPASLLPLQIGLGMTFGLSGAALGYLLSEALVCAVAAWVSRRLPMLGWRADTRLFAGLIRVGMPITIVWWTYILQTTMDRVFLMGALGDTATGLYGVGMSVAAAYLILPESVAQVLYPNVSERFGQTGRAGDLYPLVVAPMRMMGILLPLFTFALLLAMPTVFRLVLPGYLPGLGAAQVLVIGALFAGLMRTAANLLVSVNRQVLLLSLVAGALALNVAGNVVVLALGLGITGIAISTTVSSACLTLAVWYGVAAALGASVRKRLSSTASMFAPPLLFTALFLVAERVLRALPQRPDVTGGLIACVLALYAATLLAFPGSRREIAGFPRVLRSGLAVRTEIASKAEGTGK